MTSNTAETSRPLREESKATLFGTALVLVMGALVIAAGAILTVASVVLGDTALQLP
ncbi:hypothetical protein GCM10017608_27720 [Agromyces luteolus]|uniref:Uncharacterized protein n=1 Tax=Agromyces luteolus TaxID=88373 RepID=A0A7C9HIP7_9MICO|nr:hypothetical protein [Agromyces luteolus]MUN06122.1 hypothetical protein [Agromyces luteolus]GLK28837.1 hypothetical protein GCM10017608_27720 [Agromyces luteolus]